MFSLTPAVEIKVLDKRIHEWGLPRYQSAMAAAIDLFACIDRSMTIPAGTKPRLISAGISIHMANPHIAALITPRSGLGHNKGLVLGNLQGVIDADYVGEIKISAWNRNARDTAPIVIEPGERIAQMMFVPIIRPTFEVVEDFSLSTDRGAGGFGSTG